VDDEKKPWSLSLILTGLRILIRYVHPGYKAIAKLVRMVDGGVEL
jgi:hypothetical protein